MKCYILECSNFVVKDTYALGITAVTMIVLIVLGRSLWAVYRRFWPQGMRAPDIEETIPMTVVAPPASPRRRVLRATTQREQREQREQAPKRKRKA